VAVGAADGVGIQVQAGQPGGEVLGHGGYAYGQAAKADLVPKDTNLRGVYATFAELTVACQEWCDRVNA
jgi:hypothetical protein